MEVEGAQDLKCETMTLNNVDKNDFGTGSETEFENKDNMQWGSCRAGLQEAIIGQVVKTVKVTWKGEGLWTPAYFCFIAGIRPVTATTCKPVGDAKLPMEKDDSITLECEFNLNWNSCEADENGWCAVEPKNCT